MKREVMFVTGDRAEYDLIKPVMHSLETSCQFSVSLVVCGSHLVAKYGKTIDKIKADGFEIRAVVNNLFASEDPATRAKSLGAEIMGLADTIAIRKPDFLAVLGDREDCLATAALGVYSQIPVIHLGGGDSADDGNSDNPIRDAVTKLSHIHFVTTPKSHARVESLGEEPWRVFTIGATGLDSLRQTATIDRADLFQQLGIPSNDAPYAVVIQHPLLPEHDQAQKQMVETLEALVAADIFAYISRPNSDPGNDAIHYAIDAYASKHEKIVAFRHMDRDHFVNLMRNAAVLVGNSSSGILEAPFLKLPTINVGRRQLGRECAENVVFVDHDRHEILREIDRALYDPQRIKEVQNLRNPYGNGDSGDKALEALLLLEPKYEDLLLKRQNF